MLKLTIELVPETCWESNIRTNVSEKLWDVIRKISYKKANYKCEICGEIGPKWPVECHEQWLYNEKTKIQKLIGLISLCPDCHKVKHYGRSVSIDYESLLINHLIKVNNSSYKDVMKHINKSFDIWKDRNKIDWKLDISYIKEYVKNNLYLLP